MPRVVIVGGGISGLSTAYYLSKRGIPSTLIEKQSRLGGLIQTEEVNGCLIEGGPDSFLSAKPWARELIQEIGLADQILGSNDHLRVTYIWRGGRLIPMPEGMVMMVPTKIWPFLSTSLLSPSAKVRMGLEWFRRPGHRPHEDQSVSEFIANHFGNEAVDYLVEPLLSGIYGGNPAELSVDSVLPRFVELERKYGSLTRGLLQERKSDELGKSTLFSTLKGGMQQLTNALEQKIGASLSLLHGTAESIERSAAGFRVRLNDSWIDADRLVLACPAHQAAAMVNPLNVNLGAMLASIPYTSSLMLALGFDKKTFQHPLHGFGFLVPKRERRRLVACTWVGKKFEHRVPPDTVLLRCFLGGAGDEQTLSETDETLEAQVRDELRTIMGVEATPAFRRVFRWPRSMPQYQVGHSKLVARIEGQIERHGGLFLTGNAYHGIGVPDCVRMGKQTAERLASSILSE